MNRERRDPNRSRLSKSLRRRRWDDPPLESDLLEIAWGVVVLIALAILSVGGLIGRRRDRLASRRGSVIGRRGGLAAGAVLDVFESVLRWAFK